MEGTSSLDPQTFYAQKAIVITDQGSGMSAARTMSIVVAVFTALTLAHAAFVDYRASSALCTASEIKKVPAQMQYLQARKFGVETSATAAATVVSMEGSVCWRGRVRQKWTESGLECSAFELLVRMKGGPTRARLLALLKKEPKNKLQLANEAGLDWKAVDRHVDRLAQCSMVQVAAVAGTCTVYKITEKGLRALEILECQEK